MKLIKVGLWKTLTLVATTLAITSISLTSVANDYEPLINKNLGLSTSKIVNEGDSSSEDTQYFKSDYDDASDVYKAKAKLMRNIAGEGTVLLKNENDSLPISSGKVTLLGSDALVHATSHGGGSMDATTLSYATGLKKALEVDRLTVSTSAEDSSGSIATIVVIGRSAGEGADLPQGNLALTNAETDMISQAKSIGGKVIILMSGDYLPEISSLVVDDQVDAIVKIGNVGYRGAYGVADVLTGIVNPSGRLVETYASYSKSSPAMMNFGNFAYSNGSAIMASQAKNYVVYSEGIYTDYKYYETRYEDVVLGKGNASSEAGTYSSNNAWTYAEEVLYPYGYGLSYTTFSKEIVGTPKFDESNHTALVDVKVKNTGNVAGKEVVQLYGQSPYTQYDIDNKVEKSSVQLLSFGKTNILNSGQEEILTLSVNMQWLASYDYTNAKTYIMDEGDYYFAIGDDSHEAINNILAAKGKNLSDGMDSEGNESMTYKWNQQSIDVDTYSRSIYTNEKITNSFDDADLNNWLEDGQKITYLSRNDWNGTYPSTISSLKAPTNMISSLNDTKKYANAKWNDTKLRADSSPVTYVDSSTNDNILSVMLLRGLDYDDDAWNVILDNLTIDEMSNMVANGRQFINECVSVSFPASTGSDSPIGLDVSYKYSKIDKKTGEKTEIGKTYMVTDGITDDQVNLASLTSSMFPSEPVLAATFNDDLAYEQGKMYGEDGLYSETSFLWGLGANLHRNPYGGRAAEYFSADSVHSTLLGAHMTKGAKSKGQVLVAKHFVANEQEQNRIGVATFLNEQTLRENYLRAFEGIATYGEMQGLMASYNRLGLISTDSEYDLLTTVLRNEWGSHCYVISDLHTPTAGLYDGNAMIAAGTSTVLNNGSFDSTSGSYVNCTLSPDNIKNDPVLLNATRTACHRLMYVFVNSMAMNGLSSSGHIVRVTPWWKITLIALDIVLGLVSIGSIAIYMVSVNWKKEE